MNMKRRFFFGLLTPGRIIFILILILDEPMNGLDKNGVREMRELFNQMKQEGKLLILASHNREDIDVLCDEVYQMENGILKKEVR